METFSKILQKKAARQRYREILKVKCPICGLPIARDAPGILGGATKAYIHGEMSFMQVIAARHAAHFRHNHTAYDMSIAAAMQEESEEMGRYGDFKRIRTSLHDKPQFRPTKHAIIPESSLTYEDIMRREINSDNSTSNVRVTFPVLKMQHLFKERQLQILKSCIAQKKAELSKKHHALEQSERFFSGLRNPTKIANFMEKNRFRRHEIKTLEAAIRLDESKLATLQ